MSGKIERPRGTHDVVPAEMPVWQRVTGEVERLCALYGYRKILTPVFEDTALFARTSGQGSDVVQKEMYTFTDRSDRSLTLRPEGTAPICRAYVEHGMHREPQPLKLFTIAPMYRYGAPGRGPLPRALAGIGRGDRHPRPLDRRRADPAVRHAPPPARRRRLPPRAQLDRLPGVPPGLPRERSAPGSRRTSTASMPRPEPRSRRARCASSTTTSRSPTTSVPRSTRRRRSASRSARPASRTSPPSRPTSTRPASRYTLVPTLVRGLDYYTRTTWEFIGPMDNENSTISGGGRYDGLVEEIGGPPTPGVGFGAGLERLIIAMEDAGESAEQAGIDVFFALEEGAPRQDVTRWLAELRAGGVAADTDYAGRSLKGQLTQAGRLGAAATVVVGPDSAVLRRPGEADEPIAPADIVGRLSG